MKQNLKKQVDELVKVSTVSSILHKIIKVIEDKKSSIRDLEKVIEHDPVIASRVVGVSNAVYYGFPRRISSISQAILVLGFEMVKGLAISTTVFNGLANGKSDFVIGLWTHSFEVAIASSILAGKTGAVSKDSAFMTGLLHDVGRPILYQLFGEKYSSLEKLGKHELIKGEERLFGASHAEVGSWFADKCKFPEECVKAINRHHLPELYTSRTDSPLSNLVPVVYLADLLAEAGPSCLLSKAHTRILSTLGLNSQSLVDIQNEILSMHEDIKKYYL